MEEVRKGKKNITIIINQIFEKVYQDNCSSAEEFWHLDISLGMDLEAEEDISHKQSLKAAIHFTVGRICEKVGCEHGMSFNKQVIATLSELTVRQIEVYTEDLEAFSKHARRTTINIDDVKLLVRRNKDLLEKVTELAGGLEKPPGRKRGRKKSKNAAGSSKDASEPQEIEEID